MVKKKKCEKRKENLKIKSMFVLLERGLKSLNMHLIFRLMLVLKFLNITVHRFWLELLCQAVLLQVKACVCVCVCVCVFFFFLNRFLFCFIMIAIIMYFFLTSIYKKKKILGCILGFWFCWLHGFSFVICVSVHVYWYACLFA